MIQGMDESFRQDLADWMDRRREDLGLRWEDVAARMGLSRQAVLNIRSGATKLKKATSKRAIEDALEWARGSVDAVLAGGEPTAIVPPPGEGPDSTPERTVSTLLENIIKVRRAFGDDAARAFIEGAFARPVESEGRPASDEDHNEETG